MRVVNDREERTQETEVGFLSLLTHVLIVSLGMATFVLAPIPMILSHMRLLEPWPKIAIVLGALLALVFLEVPVSAIVPVFIFGMYVSDSVNRKSISLWQLLGSSALVALSSGFAVLAVESSLENMDLVTYWQGLITSLVDQMKTMASTSGNVEWDIIRSLLFYEGPFLLIATAIFSVWISIGICAHAKWLNEKNAYISSALRKLEPSLPLSFLFVLLVGASRYLNGDLSYFFGGAGRIVSVLLFIQGTIVLSKWMSRKKMGTSTRTAFYSFFILLGFYALIGIGFVSPLFRLRVGFPKMKEAV